MLHTNYGSQIMEIHRSKEENILTAVDTSKRGRYERYNSVNWRTWYVVYHAHDKGDRIKGYSYTGTYAPKEDLDRIV